MTATLLRISWISLKRDRAALILTFVLPIIFFTIFGLVFSNMGGGNPEDVDLQVLVVDLDDSKVSRDLSGTLAAHEALSVSMAPQAGETAGSVSDPGAEIKAARWTRETAHKAVRQGEADAALILPDGLGAAFGSFSDQPPEVELIYDASNPMTDRCACGCPTRQSSPPRARVR